MQPKQHIYLENIINQEILQATIKFYYKKICKLPVSRNNQLASMKHACKA